MNPLDMNDINNKTFHLIFPLVVGQVNIKHRLKNWQKISNNSCALFFIYVVPGFVWSFYKRNLDANPTTNALKNNCLKWNEAFKLNMEECKSLCCKVWNIKDSCDYKKVLKYDILSLQSAVQTENVPKNVLMTVKPNINKGVLSTVYKNQTIEEWVH